MMKEENNNAPDLESLPQAVVQRKKQISIVWLVPIVAILIGGWLAYKGLTEKGPEITISFKSAEGLEAGKTKLKYKDVEIGQVQTIRFNADLSRVLVTAELVKEADPHLTENTRFWVVRPRVTASGVSGLGTIFSGAYIGMDPGKEGKPARKFEGLEIPPVVTRDMPGRDFRLRASTLGSLDIGAPVYYRQIQVGQVTGYELDKTAQSMIIKVFINAPHDELVRKNTRFWNASGFDLKLDAGGLKINTESLVSIMLGGIAFETPTSLEAGGPAEEGDEFRLYETRDSIFERTYTEKRHFILNFNESIRGLTVGAPVEFRGIKIGQVVDIKAEYDLETTSPRITVLIETEPERWGGNFAGTVDSKQQIQQLVEKGLRAQLKTGSLLTGQLFVDVDFHPDAPEAEVKFEQNFAEIPTIPAPLQVITARVNDLLSKLETLPIEQIGKDLGDTLQNVRRLSESKELLEAVQALNETLHHTRQLVQNLDSNVAPAMGSTLDQAQKTLVSVEGTLGKDAPLQHEMRRALKELAEAARGIRILTDYLERHPDALIYGKGKEQ
ncbi:MAG: MCE family protein [Deltaproteobacteria bacterium]|jgi:paraquat-inducible protein B|nr:MCE family protein [Deltaproteobacteria bacterium]